MRPYEWASALTGAIVIGDMFAPWYRVGGAHPHGVNAFDAFTVVDVFVALAALLAVGLAAMAAGHRAPALPIVISALVPLAGGVATVLVLVRVASVPALAGAGAPVTREAGLWIGLAGCVALVLFAWRNMKDEILPDSVAPNPTVTHLLEPTPEGGRQ